MTDVAERLRAAGLAVKPLEWMASQGGYYSNYYRSPGYRIEEWFGTDSFFFETRREDGWIVLYAGDDLPAAKAAAQADYESRILAAFCATLDRSAHTTPEQALGLDETETRPHAGQ